MGLVNMWLQQNAPSAGVLDVLIEVEHAELLPQVATKLSYLSPAARPIGRVFNFQRALVNVRQLAEVAALPGVVRVSYNAPMWIRRVPALDFNALNAEKVDPVLGRIRLSRVEIPLSPREMLVRSATLLPLSPIGIAMNLLGIRQQSGFQDIIIVPTSETRKLLNPPEDNKTTKTKVAVLDTGLSIPHPAFHPSKGFIHLETLTGEPPFDGLGHGQWCTAAAFGDTAQTRFGLVQGVADPENGTLAHFKVLSNAGFGSNFSVLQGMERAVNWGAKVISMSLGGELQGSVKDDPQCVAIEKLKDRVIFVVAAGNSGPDGWQVGTPGAAPDCICVGAWSSVYNGLAIFSSRGPSGLWYKEHQYEWERDLAEYGDRLIKPDCVAPGGGPVTREQKVDQIYSAVTGWTDGMNDGAADGFDAMRGTSMATPAAAGLISLAVERGLVQTAEDVRRLLRETWDGAGIHEESGYGMITWGRMGGT